MSFWLQLLAEGPWMPMHEAGMNRTRLCEDLRSPRRSILDATDSAADRQTRLELFVCSWIKSHRISFRLRLLAGGSTRLLQQTDKPGSNYLLVPESKSFGYLFDSSCLPKVYEIWCQTDGNGVLEMPRWGRQWISWDSWISWHGWRFYSLFEDVFSAFREKRIAVGGLL